MKNHAGDVLDFHSLRHTCGAWLAINGEQLKVIQTIMRHSSITLTMDTYGHLLPGQESDAIEKLQSIMGAENNILEAIGTDVGYSPLQHQRQQSGRDTLLSGAKACEKKNDNQQKQKTPKPIQIANLGDDLLLDATDHEGRPGGIRTPDQGIMSPLL